jgi:nucleotide-binding universal stress UspA family protein
MYSRILIPLDGSKVAEQVLPYARFLVRTLGISVDFLGVVNPEPLEAFTNRDKNLHIDALLTERVERSKSYLETIARSFQGASIRCLVEKGKPEEVIIERAAADSGTMIAMATHGRSGIQRWLLGSVAEKVLRGASNHLLLIRASEGGKTDGDAALKTVIVPLDGSPLAEKVLPLVADLVAKMGIEVVLMRAYALPPSVTAEDYGANLSDLLDEVEAEARDYIADKVKELKEKGLKNVSSALYLGYGAEEIITLGRKTPDNFIAMCTHGRSGVKRWVLGSVTERVVRHSGDPVLIVRAQT